MCVYSVRSVMLSLHKIEDSAQVQLMDTGGLGKCFRDTCFVLLTFGFPISLEMLVSKKQINPRSD